MANHDPVRLMQAERVCVATAAVDPRDRGYALLPADQPRVLVILIDHHLGNTVVGLPIVAAFAAYFRHPVDVLVDERYAGLARLVPSIGRVLTYPSQARSSRKISRGLAGLFYAARLWTKRYKAVIDVIGGKHATMLTIGSFAPTRIGPYRSPRRWVYTDKVFYPPREHVFEQYAHVLGRIGQQGPPAPLRLVTPAAALQRVRARIDAALPSRQRPIAVIHPFSGKAIRCWPLERFIAVANSLIQQRGMRVVVVGTEAERDRGRRLVGRIPQGDQACYMTLPLVDLLALFELGSVLVSVESGPTHLAATTEIPIVTIFGPTQEANWRPIRRSKMVTLRGARCDPGCDGGRCVAGQRCLTELTPTQVLHAVDSLT